MWGFLTWGWEAAGNLTWLKNSTSEDVAIAFFPIAGVDHQRVSPLEAL